MKGKVSLLSWLVAITIVVNWTVCHIFIGSCHGNVTLGIIMISVITTVFSTCSHYMIIVVAGIIIIMHGLTFLKWLCRKLR